MVDKKAVYRWFYHKYIWYREVIKRHNGARIGLGNRIKALKYGFSSDFFKLYHLDRNSPEDYISEYKRIISRDIVGDYKVLLDDKIIFTEFFSRYVKVPEIVYLIDGGLMDSAFNRISFGAFLSEFKGRKYIVKPIKGACGRGVHIIEENDGIFIDYQKADEKALEELCARCDKSIVNEYICQHVYASRVFPGSVNTIRLITIRDPDTGDVLIPCAAHRFGNSTTGAVDNVSSGGFVTQIDIETGILGYGRQFGSDDPIEVHPDTGADILGVQIPNWQGICANILSAARHCPYLPFIAWDIAVTEDSFVVLEANASCSLELFQMFGSIKGTKLWDFYRHYGIVK